MHVSPASTCSACNAKIDTCHNTLKIWWEILSDNFPDCHIAIGFRSEQDQEAAVHSHLTHAPWPKSKHNRMENGKPSSWAIDVFRLDANGKAYFEPEYFEKIWKFIDTIQIQVNDRELFWGGLFTNLKDSDHFELLKVDIVQSIQVLSQDSC